jgi:hypothetical protein
MAQGKDQGDSGRPKRDGPRRGSDTPRGSARGDGKRTPPRREGRPDRQGTPPGKPARAERRPAAEEGHRPGKPARGERRPAAEEGHWSSWFGRAGGPRSWPGSSRYRRSRFATGCARWTWMRGDAATG